MTELDSSSRNWALSAHLVGMFAGWVIPFGNIFGPLIIWLVKKDEDRFVAHHAVEAVNFQITVMLYAVLFVILALALVGIPLLIALPIYQLVCGILATIAASKGEWYRYPATWRPMSV